MTHIIYIFQLEAFQNFPQIKFAVN